MVNYSARLFSISSRPWCSTVQNSISIRSRRVYPIFPRRRRGFMCARPDHSSRPSQASRHHRKKDRHLKASARSRISDWELCDQRRLRSLIGTGAVLVSILLGRLLGSASGSELGDRSGLPIPRFVSVKSKPANVRAGPGVDYPLRWTFVRRHLPVEILAEFGNWRRIRDSDGEEGWILAALLSGRRTALIAPWSAAKPVRLLNRSRRNATVNAVVEPHVLVRVDTCAGTWCHVRAQTFSGYVRQSRLWGVYPGEVF